jgi:hypothetical protein
MLAHHFSHTIATGDADGWCRCDQPLSLQESPHARISNVQIALSCWSHNPKFPSSSKPWNCWGLCWYINVGPPLFTLLQLEIPTDVLVWPTPQPPRVPASSNLSCAQTALSCWSHNPHFASHTHRERLEQEKSQMQAYKLALVDWGYYMDVRAFIRTKENRLNIILYGIDV